MICNMRKRGEIIVGLVAFLSLNGALVTAQVPALTFLLRGEAIPENEVLEKEDVGFGTNQDDALSVVTPFSREVRCYYPDGQRIPDPSFGFQWSASTATFSNGSQITRLLRREDLEYTDQEGVWRCSVPTDNSHGRRSIYIGLYTRSLNNGVLTIYQDPTLTAVSPLLTEPPTYTLTAHTTGGPPGSVEWRVGSTVLTGNTVSVDSRRRAAYTHRLTVTGRHSDPIVFTASNRRTSSAPSRQLSVPFPNPLTNVQALQVGDGQVQVTWTLPTATLIQGLSLSVTGQLTPTSLGSDATTHTVSNVVTGTQISIVSLSSMNRRTLYSTAATTTVGMLLALPTPVISSSSALSSTSLRVEWTLSSGSGNKSPDEIIINYSRRTCSFESGYPISLGGSLRTRDIDGLDEFSMYDVTVTAVYRFGSNPPVTKESAGSGVRTLPAAPSSGPPGLSVQNVMATSVEVSWNELACLDQNGVITGYKIRYVGDSQIITDSSSGASRTYTVEGLIPFTDYSISVAAVNSVGTGPFSEQPVTTRTTASKLQASKVSGGCQYVGAVVGSVFATLLLYTVLLMIVLLVCFYWRKKLSTPVNVKSKQQQEEKPDEEGRVYDVIEPTDKAIPLKQCAAYGDVHTRQQTGDPQDVEIYANV